MNAQEKAVGDARCPGCKREPDERRKMLGTAYRDKGFHRRRYDCEHVWHERNTKGSK